MLRTNAELERPDLMLFMVRHWLDVHQNKKVDGFIHIGTFVTHIAERLGVSLAGFHLSKGPIVMDAKAYQQALFIKIARGTANHSDRYFWRMPDGTQHQLPLPAPLIFEDDNTFLFTGPPPVQPQPPPFAPQDTDMPDATRMGPDATRFPSDVSRFHASTSAAAPSYPPPLDSPTIHDVYSLVCDMRYEQGAILYDLQSRVTAMEDAMRDWRFDPSDD